MIQKYLSSYCDNWDTSKEINVGEKRMANKRKWEIDVNFAR